ncbi:MAG: hypothetical protein ACFNQF_09125 [Bacteroides sp.]
MAKTASFTVLGFGASFLGQIQVINATPQKGCLAYKKSPEAKRRKTPPFSLGWLNVYTFGFRPKK